MFFSKAIRREVKDTDGYKHSFDLLVICEMENDYDIDIMDVIICKYESERTVTNNINQLVLNIQRSLTYEDLFPYDAFDAD